MAKRLFLFLSYLVILSTANAQLQTPEQFLGYKIGTRFTPHHRLVEYFRHVAAAMPNAVRLQQYGETNERRPLYTAFISAPANISNLENIRQNNLRLAGMNNSSALSNAPAIVWLSYNVHGDEASSSEAALLTLYSLVDPANTRTKAWLQNTVVVIDPCMNPDGRDRYVNWYNTAVGSINTPELAGREHSPPWPRGRTNHYYFDLNRDWAWQTQKETQQRMVLYNSWLPQIHVDFHEQGIDNPYYFAPGAEPYHESITPWQRSFEATIGKNNAKYFDERGWLYFTKEFFDLIYPAYGDTYPLLSGAIVMTYEQAGGGAAGLAAITSTGDTLTLTDRATHHLTTGLSTVEVASQHAAKLLSEFQNFYSRTSNKGSGVYQSYVIKNNPQDAARIQTLLQMLDRNKIEYGVSKGGSIRGYNYANGKDESFTIANGDIIIQTAQPRGVLVNALFEPVTKFSDSLTYDITAWSLPYAFGLTAYATRQPVSMGSYTPAQRVQNTSANPYAYVIRWNGLPAVKLTTQLMQRGIKLRMQSQPFTVGGQNFERGSVLVLRTGNQYYENLWQTVRQLADEHNVQLVPVTTGFVERGVDFGSSKVASLKTKRIAVLSGEGVFEGSIGEVWHFFDQELKYPVTLINTSRFSRTNLSDFDVIILPNGNYTLLSEKASSDRLKDWISNGGTLVAMENAVAQLSKTDWAIKAKKDDDATKDSNSALRRFEDAERQFLASNVPGTIFKVHLDNSHPLAFGYPDYYYTLKQDDMVYDYFKADGWNVGVLKNEGKLAGVLGSKVEDKLKNGVLFGTQSLGGGNIVYLTDNVLFRSFWENGKLMFSNAVFLVGQ